jgi:hypothetical protein
LSSTDEPEVQTEKSGSRPNFLGKLWKAQTTSSTDSTSPSKPAALTSSPVVTTPPVATSPPVTPSSAVTPLAPEPQVSAAPPAAGGTEGDDDPKAAPPSKFLSKLWKAQKSSSSPDDSNITVAQSAGSIEPVDKEALTPDLEGTHMVPPTQMYRNFQRQAFRRPRLQKKTTFRSQSFRKV